MSTNEKRIWDYLLAKGLSAAGAAGLMGNLYAESGLNPQNLQNTYEKKLGYTDAAYTAAVDSGKYQNFIHDSAGYGLAQWTFWSRKQNLLNFARAAGKSIGDLDMQLDFLFEELSTGYKSVLSTLKTATAVRTASDSVLLNFERPANQGEAVKIKRAGYGQSYYDKYAMPANGGNSMSNSSLVNYTKLSPNHSGARTHAIDRITPHCVVGQCSVETLGNVFAPTSRQASCNYGIGVDGRVLLCVNEGNRSWCTSSNANDQRAVTIECASDTTAPYAFKDVVYQKLITLCVDICKRNGKKKLLWLGDKDKTLNYSPKSDEMILTVHRWFANKSCPGDWMYARMGDLASKVTAQLGGSTTQPSTSTTPSASTEGLDIGTVVNFAGGKHYTSANATSGSAAKAGPAKITAMSANAKHPYHIIHTDATSNVYGWVDADAISVAGGSTAQPSTPSAPAAGLGVGTVVNFAGGKHYTSANAASGSTAKAGPAKITAVSANAKHPYHVIHTDATSNVYGWVDANAISVAGGSADVNYLVRITATDLNIRSGPGTGYARKGFIKPGVYTIVEESTGAGASKWGKLKSGAGWVSLDYCTKM